jgi:hypothetical protein
MEETLRECRKIVEQLTCLFRRFNGDSGGLVQAAIMQYRLQFQGEQISGLGERIALL